ncbi:MAG TPA: xanthine dehydrogenase family protein molybdopterin-binding subunit [Pseudomonadales bacterium]|nr:xanthine dehydrogenase family protein molybdopterin-binding subunit [Pseudomonadales bacterium]
MRRTEDPRLLSGRGEYLDDLHPAGCLHAAFVRSPHAHARVLAVETGAARAVSGVRGALSGADLVGTVGPLAPRLEGGGYFSTAWAPLAPERARFVGEAVGVVAADSPYAAADGAEAMDVVYAPLAVVADAGAALAPDAPRVHDALPGNLLFERRHRRGDVEEGFARAAVRIAETFTHARVSASPLETRGIVASWDGGRLTAWMSTQIPHVMRVGLAGAFGLDGGQVRVIVPDTGGGFGQKMHLLPEDLAVAALARLTGRPVKWVETRRENLAAASQAREARVEVEAAADARGVLLALRARVYSDAGAYQIFPLTQALEPLGIGNILPGPYLTPAYEWHAVAVATNKPPLGAYRGVGMTMGAFAMERTLDLLAARLGLDPAEVRRRNLIPRERYPFTSASGFVYDSGDFPAALADALERARYDERRVQQTAERAQGRLVGVGIACYTESTGIGSRTYRGRGMMDVPGDEAATVRVTAHGDVICEVSFPTQGQGHGTTVAQLVADRLGVPLERVTVRQPDTDVAPAGSGTFASRGAIVSSGAADGAARRVRERVLALAARRLEVSAADLVLAGGRASVRGVPDRGLALGEIARIAESAGTDGAGNRAGDGAGDGAGAPAALAETERFDPPGPTFSGAVHVATVEVDAETGRVTVRDYVVVEDCGPVINPMIVRGQIHGALAQGIGEALGERLVYDEAGQLLTGTLMEYALPAAADLPSFDIGHRETPSPLTPGGYKGMGEGGTIGAPAAIANAVADAVAPLGVAVTALPILPERLRPR